MGFFPTPDNNVTTLKNMKISKILLSLAMLLAVWPASRAQDVGIKTNLLYDGLATPSLALEIGLAPKWSLDLSGALNAWPINDHKRKIWLFQPEARYWFCQRFSGHFLAVHGHGGQYNVGNINIGGHNFLGSDLKALEKYRFQGWYVGAGVGYGYSWILDKHWNIEAEIGIGWAYTRFDKFRCTDCGKKLNDEPLDHNYFGPTKAAVNLIYYF